MAAHAPASVKGDFCARVHTSLQQNYITQAPPPIQTTTIYSVHISRDA